MHWHKNPTGPKDKWTKVIYKDIFKNNKSMASVLNEKTSLRIEKMEIKTSQR